MGACISLMCSKSAAVADTHIQNVRVVDLNGCVEEFDYPVTVRQLMGRPPGKHSVFTASQLLSAGLKPLKPETLLERGRVYFLLPSSCFDHADVSPLNLATTVRQLTKRAASKSSSLLTSNSSLARVSPSPAAAKGLQLSSEKRPWRPILETIREMSFNRKSVSNLPDICFQDP